MKNQPPCIPEKGPRNKKGLMPCMRSCLCFFVLISIFSECFAVDYYSRGSVCPNVLSNWDLNPGGGAGAPVNFSNPGDKFIIQNGHTMITTNTWIIGGAGSILQIQNGGTLQGNHLIILSGTFQIDNGGTYVHNNTGAVAEASGNSIFSGTELFAAGSNFEIRRWPGKNVGLPNESPGISWGNLVINLQADISADTYPWNWNVSDGSTLAIKGDLDIRATYVGLYNSTVLCLTSSGVQTINVGGNFLLSGIRTKVSVRDDFSNGYVTMQVNGNILLKDICQFNIGATTSYSTPQGLYELRFKGDFAAIDNSLLIYEDDNPVYLVANGTNPQNFSCKLNFNRKLRVAPGSTLNLVSPLYVWAKDAMLAILGTFNQNGNSLLTYGKIESAGGVFNSSGILYLGDTCTACTNLIGTYNSANKTWCNSSGTKGRINFINTSIVSLDNDVYPDLLTAGSSIVNSPGDIYFVNSTTSCDVGMPGTAVYSVYGNSVLSLDANSYIGGEGASYLGKGGSLHIGSPEGITEQGNITKGNIRTALVKDYDFSGANSFEYFGTNPQFTGPGLPSTIDGTLKINNSAGPGTSGVTLSQTITVSGILDLTLGKLTTSSLSLIAVSNGGSVNLPVRGASYVVGPMKKIGSTSFSFPIGKGNNFAPLALTGTGNANDEYIAEYFMANPIAMIGSSFDNPPINHLSALEWWTVDRSTASIAAKSVTLEATTYSDAILLSDLRVLRWDGAAWKTEGNTACSGVSSGPVTSNAINSFFAAGAPTPFTFGSVSPAVDVLAVNLVSFDAVKLTTTKALLNWELAKYCSSAARFEIEKANGNRDFTRIAILHGSETNRLYNYIDNSLKSGVSYYRLKMIDADGKIIYSRIAAVMNGVSGLLLTSLIPTIITNGRATLTIASSRQQKFDLVITDILGRIILKQNQTVAAGNTTIQLSLDHLSAGVYQLTGTSGDDKANVIKFIKQ